jgi:fused signal recognition particle receptor
VVALWIALGVAAIVVLVAGSLGYVTRARRTRGRERRRHAPTARPTPKAPPAPTIPKAPPAPTTPTAEPAVHDFVRAPALDVAPPSFVERLGRTRGVFAGLRAMRGHGIDPEIWDQLEESLLRADVGVATTDALLSDLHRRVKEREIDTGDQLVDVLRADLVDLLSNATGSGTTDGHQAARAGSHAARLEIPEQTGRELRFDDEEGVVNVWLFVGVNGVGKTTTVGKVARQQVAAGRGVLLAAGDTFRAAAGEQLAMWAQRVGIEIVRGAEGGDPSAIVFDAVQRAAARGNSLVLADTAGRLHTKVNLVEELKKIRRVADRAPGRVSEVLLVLDATTGQNGLVQARQFTEAVTVTGVVLTKLDGTAKGGIVVAIQRELGLPVKLVGLGEGPDDLVPFDPADFVDALLG